jgi:hypothetical protein
MEFIRIVMHRNHQGRVLHQLLPSRNRSTMQRQRRHARILCMQTGNHGLRSSRSQRPAYAQTGSSDKQRHDHRFQVDRTSPADSRPEIYTIASRKRDPPISPNGKPSFHWRRQCRLSRRHGHRHRSLPKDPSPFVKNIEFNAPPYPYPPPPSPPTEHS